MAVGVPVGYSRRQLMTEYDSPGWGTVYMIGLSLLTEALALLTLGLVRSWGETTPDWLPVVGGKRVDPRFAVSAGYAGAGVLVLVWWGSLVALLFTDFDQAGSLAGGHYNFMLACYAPLLAWGPLLAAVTVSYSRRQRVRASAVSGPQGRLRRAA
jgi:hypothetical protein